MSRDHVHQDAGPETTGLLPGLRSSPRNMVTAFWFCGLRHGGLQRRWGSWVPSPVHRKLVKPLCHSQAVRELRNWSQELGDLSRLCRKVFHLLPPRSACVLSCVYQRPGSGNPSGRGERPRLLGALFIGSLLWRMLLTEQEGEC